MTRQISKNNILNLLPASTYNAWAPYFEVIELPMGKVLYDPSSTLSHMYFPTSAIVSWVYMLENGATTEIASTLAHSTSSVAPMLIFSASETGYFSTVER